jgi:hypothetical protein
MRRLAREPLLHFLLLGGVIFGVFALVSRNDASRPGEIVVTEGRIASLGTAFARVWHRPPTGPELDGLMRDYVRDEVLAREALALGLDRDDTIIRRRLRQKLEFVSEDVAALAEPTEEQLHTYLKQHPDAFRARSPAASASMRRWRRSSEVRKAEAGRRRRAPLRDAVVTGET